MTQCNRQHAVNQLCTARDCFLGEQNPFLRLQRRFDRQARELNSVRKTLVQRLSRAGVEG